MKNKQIIEKRCEEVVSITCDVCKTTYDRHSFQMQEFLSYKDTGGYGSIIGDMVTKEIDICESCVIGLLGPYLRTKNIQF